MSTAAANQVAHWPHCPDCHKPFEFDPAEPFAYCGCGTTEWGSSGRPAPWVPNPILARQQLMTQRNELADMVGKFQRALTEIVDKYEEEAEKNKAHKDVAQRTTDLYPFYSAHLVARNALNGCVPKTLDAEYQQLQRTALGWQRRAETAEKGWRHCYALAATSWPPSNLGADPEESWPDVARVDAHTDKAILDWIDSQRENVVAGQDQANPYGEHVANSWHVEWPASDIRTAVLAIQKQQAKDGK